MALDIARILKVQQTLQVSNTSLVSNSPKESRMKLAVKQLTDYQTLIVLDSESDILTGYQKIPYHMVFDIKYDLRHKERLVVVGNWTANDKEDIYSGDVCMDTVRIGFFLGEL
jgi:hypothetical protein